MTKQEIFDYFYTNSANFGAKSILLTMLGGLIIAAIIYVTYYISYKGVAYNNKFNMSLVMTLLISIVIMLMISSNIVISLGMVGALSIVRFRTAIKDSRDTIFIFWAITEGLCVGSLNFRLALFTSLFISILLIASCYLQRMRYKYLLVVQGETTPIDAVGLIEKMNPYIVDQKLRTANKNDVSQEMIFEIRTKGEIDLEIIDKLLEVKGVKSVNWISESGETLG